MARKTTTKLFQVGLFFGAGAEIAYGLPSGGKFALEIFRRNTDQEKQNLRTLISNIDKTTIYSADFLPHDFESKRISTFGRGDYKALLASSMEYRKQLIIDFLNAFDFHARACLKHFPIPTDIIEAKFLQATGKDFGSVNYDQEISLNESLHADTTLFGSEFFSAMLDLLRANATHKLLRRILRAFMQLLVGCYGQRLASELSELVFTRVPEGLPVFDDITGVLQVEISQAGLTALELILEEEAQAVSEDTLPIDVFAELARSILENLVEQCLDYQSLIDDHFRYLYEPKAHWGNFTKIVVFLNVVRNYIMAGSTGETEKIKAGPGYYHDLLNFSAEGLQITRVGTTNYNDLIITIAENAIPNEVEHLNGSVSDFYDPYLNKIVRVPVGQDCTTQRHVIVPFLFTQSGIKPLTSVEMSRRYVQLFDDYLASDAIVVIGFGFNRDDGHINGLFRALIEEEEKTVFLITYGRSESSDVLHKEFRRKMRIEGRASNLHVLAVDGDRKNPLGVLWYKTVARKIRELKGKKKSGEKRE